MKQFETEAFKLILHDDLLKEFIVKKGVTLQASDVQQSLKLTKEFNPDAKFFVLMQGEDDAQISPDARRAAASEEYNTHTMALALCGTKLYEAIAGNLFLKINKPKVPTRFFYNREEALAWLRLFIKK